MDWLNDLQIKFGDRDKYPEIQTLKKDKFRGSVQIHFDNGLPLKYKLELWRTGMTITEYSNFTKGG